MLTNANLIESWKMEIFLKRLVLSFRYLIIQRDVTSMEFSPTNYTLKSTNCLLCVSPMFSIDWPCQLSAVVMVFSRCLIKSLPPRNWFSCRGRELQGLLISKRKINNE